MANMTTPSQVTCAWISKCLSIVKEYKTPHVDLTRKLDLGEVNGLWYIHIYTIVMCNLT